MANIDHAFGFRFVRSSSGDGNAVPPRQRKRMSASVTVAKGDPLHLDTDGLLQLAAAGEQIEGFAAEAKVTGVGETPFLEYDKARAGDIWRAQYATGTTVAQATIGDRVGPTGSTGAYEVTANASGAFAVSGLWESFENEFGEHAIVELELIQPQRSQAV